MMVDWAAFTPVTSLLGGALIGLSAGGLILLFGRIAGISGIVGGVLHPRTGATAWRVAFVGGLLAAPWAWRAVAASAGSAWAGPAWPPVRIDAHWAALLLAGLLVGVGTRAGSGCTSGHGVCGLSRLSPRSLVAVGCFMATGFATVFVVRHVLGF